MLNFFVNTWMMCYWAIWFEHCRCTSDLATIFLFVCRFFLSLVCVTTMIKWLDDDIRLVLIGIICFCRTLVPGQSFFVELDHNLRAFDIGLCWWYQISFVGIFPFHQEHQLTAAISCTYVWKMKKINKWKKLFHKSEACIKDQTFSTKNRKKK